MIDSQLRKLEKKFGKFAIKGLMLYIVAGMGMLYIGELVARSLPNVNGSLFQFLDFDRGLILRGQVWRLISFIFIPPMTNPVFVFMELYFCWMIGNTLENHWGSFRFNVYYIVGTLGAMIAGFITGSASNGYLNLSLLIAFAVLFPDFEILLFFIIPIKMKWIALIDAAFLIWTFILGDMSTKLTIAFCFVNLFLFLGKDIFVNIRYIYRKKIGGRKKTKEKRAKNIDISHRDK